MRATAAEVTRPHAPLADVATTSMSALLAREWDALATAVGASPFLRPRYLQLWLDTYGDGADPTIVVGRRDGRLVGALPAVRHGPSILPAGNFETPVCGIVAADPAARAGVADALFGLGARRVVVTPLVRGSPSYEALRAAAARAGYAVLTRTTVRCPVVATQGDWDDYWRGRSRNTRHKVERCARRLREMGTVTTDVRDGRDDLEALLAEGFAAEGSGWKTRAGTSILTSAETRSYYADLAAWAAERGWLRLTYLRVDGRPVAFGFGIEEGGVHHALKIGYDPAFARVSPGTLLLHELISRCFARGLSAFDFAGHDERYKSAWATRIEEYVELAAFAPTVGGRLARGRAVARRRIAASRLRPALEPIGAGTRRVARGMRRRPSRS